MTLFCSGAFAQVSVSAYSSSSVKVGVAYNFSEKLWGEARLCGNQDIDDFVSELVLCYNFVKKEQHAIYLGAGALIADGSGIVIPVGVQFTPFEKFDKFSLHIEAEPVIDLGNNGNSAIQAAWGLRYKF